MRIKEPVRSPYPGWKNERINTKIHGTARDIIIQKEYYQWDDTFGKQYDTWQGVLKLYGIGISQYHQTITKNLKLMYEKQDATHWNGRNDTKGTKRRNVNLPMIKAWHDSLV